MRILVTGSDGLVATNIIPFLKEHFEIIPALEKEWDITDRDKGRAVLRSVQPHVLLNLAAMTNVDGCEDILDRAHKVNAEGPGVLADLCREEGVKIAHFSTDYVFDGAGQRPYREDDRTNPLSVYGRTKLLGEKEVMKRTDNFLIIRTQWIYGEGGENFITKVTRLGKEKGTVSVVNDQTGSPTYAKDLAQPVAALIRGTAPASITSPMMAPALGLTLQERFFPSCPYLQPASLSVRINSRERPQGPPIRSLIAARSRPIRGFV